MQLPLDAPDLPARIAHALPQQPRLAHYRLTAELGAGGFARVYKCEREGSCFALKVYILSALREKYPPQAYLKLVGYIEQEAQLMQQCHSPHVARCLEAFGNQHYHFLVLEYCSGETLKDFLFRKGGTLEEAVAVAVIQQVCLGVAELHRHRIVHRDLKLENIMVGSGVCKIIDLGLARKVEEEAVMMTNVGTNYTKAPEIKNQQRSGLKADIYSLGIIYLMLVSDCDYDRRTRYNFHYDPHSLFRTHTVSELSCDFIRKAVEVDQFARMDWKELLAHPLFDTLQPTQQTEEVTLMNQSFRSIVLDESLTSNFLEEPLLSSSHLRSSIFEGEEDSEVVQELLRPIYETIHATHPSLHSEGEGSQGARFYELECEKGQFLLQLMGSVERINSEETEKAVLQYLLSLHALSLLADAHTYYQEHSTSFSQEVWLLHGEAVGRHEECQRRVKRLLSSVKTAFINNEILSNYNRLKSYLSSSLSPHKDVIEELVILVSFYLQRAAGRAPRKERALLRCYKEVVMLTPLDLEGASFQQILERIRAKYSYQ